MSPKQEENENNSLLPPTLIEGYQGYSGVRRGSSGIHLQIPRRRPRTYSTNSLGIYNEEGDYIISTGFGSAVVHQDTSAWDWYLGLFLAGLSGVLFTANNFFVKFFSVDPIEMLLVRSALQAFLVGAGLSCVHQKGSSWINSFRQAFVPESTCDRILVSLQGILGGLRVFLTFACVGYMPLGDALTLVFTEPLWTIILSKFILHIRIGVWKTLFGLVLVTGVVLCVQPPFLFPDPSIIDAPIDNTTDINGNVTAANSLQDEPGSDNYFLGAGLAIGAALTGSLANILIAKCEIITSSVLVFYSGMGGVIVALFCSIFDPYNKIVFSISDISLNDWAILLALGASGMIGYFSMTRSLKLIPPTTVAVLRAMEIVLAYIVQALVMGETPDLLSISGSSFVGVSVIAIALEEQIKKILTFILDQTKTTLTFLHQCCFNTQKDLYSEIM